MKHGSNYGYNQGCRDNCPTTPSCRDAHAKYMLQRRQRSVAERTKTRRPPKAAPKAPNLTLLPAPELEPPQWGPVETAVRGELAEGGKADTHPGLAALAIRCAQNVDDPDKAAAVHQNGKLLHEILTGKSFGERVAKIAPRLALIRGRAMRNDST